MLIKLVFPLSSAFKKSAGLSPSQYRKAYIQIDDFAHGRREENDKDA
jgi:AraC-like DNA-binding protein